MDQRVKELMKRLSFLGYCAHEIKAIVQEAIGTGDLDTGNWRQCAAAIAVLEKYERLGADFLYAYSK